jgi:hypothetical protein
MEQLYHPDTLLPTIGRVASSKAWQPTMVCDAIPVNECPLLHTIGADQLRFPSCFRFTHSVRWKTDQPSRTSKSTPSFRLFRLTTRMT